MYTTPPKDRKAKSYWNSDESLFHLFLGYYTFIYVCVCVSVVFDHWCATCLPSTMGHDVRFQGLECLESGLMVTKPTRWCPPSDVCWFISPLTIVSIVISTINHSYWSYVHQLSYRTGASHCRVDPAESALCPGWGTTPLCTSSTNAWSFSHIQSHGCTCAMFWHMITIQRPPSLEFKAKIGSESAFSIFAGASWTYCVCVLFFL